MASAVNQSALERELSSWLSALNVERRRFDLPSLSISDLTEITGEKELLRKVAWVRGEHARLRSL